MCLFAKEEDNQKTTDFLWGKRLKVRENRALDATTTGYNTAIIECMEKVRQINHDLTV